MGVAATTAEAVAVAAAEELTTVADGIAWGGCWGGCWAGAGDGTGRLGGVGAGTGEPLVPWWLRLGKLGGNAPGNSCFLDAGVDANITELASDP